MRLLSAILRNYRLHRELSVRLDPARTLLGGPNESGKSTFVEAVHRALFLKAKGNTEHHRAMISSMHPGTPEVELTFEAEGRTYVLRKRFGTAGAITLVPSDSPALTGDAAETELARLLGVDAGVTGRAVATQWAHLWVWQGQAGDDPSAYATAQRDGLLQRLQDLGGAAALQSDLDSRVARHFAEIHEQIYTQAGKPKIGSPLEQAERNVALTREELARASGRLQQLETAARELEQASRDVQSATVRLDELGRNQAATEARARQLATLRQQEAEQTHAANGAAERLEARLQAGQRFLSVVGELEALTGSLAPQNAAIAAAEAARNDAKIAAARTEQAQRDAAEAVRTARLRHELAAAHQVRLEKTEQHARLREKAGLADRRRQEAEQLEEQLARLPEVNAARLRKLQELESGNSRARAALEAMATALEVVTADGVVTAGDQVIGAGQRHILTDDTEVRLGSSFRLRIQPGGGTSLAEARRTEAETRQSLQRELDSLGLASLPEAQTIHARREELGARRKEVRAELEGLGAEKLGTALLRAHTELATAQANVERLKMLVPGLETPDDPETALALTKSMETRREDAEAKETEARSVRDHAARSLESTEETLQRRRAETAQSAARVTGLQAQLDLLRQTDGDDASRARALAEARTAKSSAEQLLQATVTALAVLQPELLEADQHRIRRALEQEQNERQDARTRVAVAQAALRTDGNEDPRAELATAQARADSAEENAGRVRRKAEAVALLDGLFREEQRRLAGQFTQPLADKISGYLQCIFGAGARAQVTYDDNGFTGLRLSRTGVGGETFPFDTLSGGAREQTAAAVRLALAEILAAEHGGCLPVVFDDAFAYSDPERVNQLQRMLDLAANRGLQVIVLTCNPDDYAALGARTVTLRPERSSPVSATTPAPIAGVELPEPIPANPEAGDLFPAATVRIAVTDQLRQTLLQRLSELGGQKGNQSLRLDLGWDEPTYHAVKQDLVASALLISGRGRGGSVALPASIAGPGL